MGLNIRLDRLLGTFDLPTFRVSFRCKGEIWCGKGGQGTYLTGPRALQGGGFVGCLVTLQTVTLSYVEKTDVPEQARGW